MKRRQPKVYAMLRKTYSLDGIAWRVCSMERHWR